MDGFAVLPSPYNEYAINVNGQIIDLINNEFVNHCLGPNSDYIGVSLRKNGSKRTYTVHVHRLLAIAFIPNNTGLDISYLDVNHINGIKCDNRLFNLEWVTRQGNCLHAYQNGLREDNRPTIVGFEEEDGSCVVCSIYSRAELARFIGINPSSLCEYMQKHTERPLLYRDLIIYR